jgi:RHS repeat-associated protein
VDGNTNGAWSGGSVTQTGYVTQAWWQVDLGEVHPIEHIRVWNRTDAYMERLSDFYVLVSDEPFVSSGLATTLSQPGVSAYFHSGPAGISKIFDVERTGRYVRVQLNGKNYLHMAEVEVWARPETSGASMIPLPSSAGDVGRASESRPEREPLLRCAGLGSHICFALAVAGYFDLDELDGTGPESSAGTAPAIPVARRTAASTGTGITTFSTEPRRYSLYSPEMSLLAETEHTTTSTPPIQYEYVWFAGAPVAQLTYSVPSEPLAATEVVWTVTDHLGTPKIQTGATGEILWHAEHEPYGQIYVLRAGEGRHQPLRFPGQEAEQLGVNSQNGVTDRSYNIFRWYRGGWGRYSQADPLGAKGDPHPFAYAEQNPVIFIDPTGERSRICCTPITGGPQPFNHCFVQVQDEASGVSETYSLHRMSWGHGCTFKDDGFDLGALEQPQNLSCGSWSDGCKADACAKSAHSAYPRSSVYSYIGPNSNTYTSSAALLCGFDTPPIVGWKTPGWGAQTAKPHPAKKCPSSR